MWKEGDIRHGVALTCERTSTLGNGTGVAQAQSAFARGTADSAYFATL